ncbi:unnamed protein product [Rhizoctonia solani]|uniref:Uncharacterized protein n=1 Tax=Rhizoctonia solani TaxID=456999 RepID=A0A8H3HH36_9AGAM|nr:unnamed protein product [Rhizoctonia solani]
MSCGPTLSKLKDRVAECIHAGKLRISLRADWDKLRGLIAVHISYCKHVDGNRCLLKSILICLSILPWSEANNTGDPGTLQCSATAICPSRRTSQRHSSTPTMHLVSLLFVAAAYLFPTVAGWAFLVRSQVISEGASATFEITDDGGGFTFPYTMTVLKRVTNSSDEQVGLVQTSGNETTFYWTCNQSAGTSVRFKLMSAAQVNAATSDYYEIQATKRSGYRVQLEFAFCPLHVLLVRQNTNHRKIGDHHSIRDTKQSATATNEPSSAATQTPVGAIVGAIVGGVLLLVALGLVLFWMRRHKRPSAQGMVQYDPDPHVTPFTHGQMAQTIIPPTGYVSQPNFDEEPPVYSPRDIENTTYFTGSESGRAESSYRPSPSTSKSRYLPVSTQPR